MVNGDPLFAPLNGPSKREWIQPFMDGFCHREESVAVQPASYHVLPALEVKLNV